MLGIGLSEFILVLIVALIALGPDKLPAMAKALGSAFAEFRKAGNEVRKSFDEAIRAGQDGKRPGSPVNRQTENMADKE